MEYKSTHKLYHLYIFNQYDKLNMLLTA